MARVAFCGVHGEGLTEPFFGAVVGNLDAEILDGRASSPTPALQTNLHPFAFTHPEGTAVLATYKGFQIPTPLAGGFKAVRFPAPVIGHYITPDPFVFIGSDFERQGIKLNRIDGFFAATVGDGAKGYATIIFGGRVFGRGAVAVFGQASFIRAGINIVAGAVAIAVGDVQTRIAAFGNWNATIGKRSAAITRGFSGRRSRAAIIAATGFIGAGIADIRDEVAISVGAAFADRGAWLIGAGILRIGHGITIAVVRICRGAAARFGGTGLIGTGIQRVGQAIPISIRAACSGVAAEFVGALIYTVENSIAIAVGDFFYLHVDAGLGAIVLAIKGAHDEGIGAGGVGLPDCEQRHGVSASGQTAGLGVE